MKYCIDTSSLLEAWVRRYPFDNFPGFWKRLGELFEAQIAVSSEEVLRETERKDDGLARWLKSHKESLLALTPEVQQKVTEILAVHRRLVDSRPGKGYADPFVIATAEITRTTIVTEEGDGTETRPTIPFVCARRGIKRVRIVQMIQAEKWTFG